MTVRKLGEIGVIRLFREAAEPARGELDVGIGDDCAVLKCCDKKLALSCDAMVEGTHFLRGKIAPEQLGWKALAAALSDLAAVGARPLAALLVLGLRGTESVRFVSRLRDGVVRCARRYKTPLAGGDTVRSPQGLLLSFTVIGGAGAGRLVLRSGARPGHLVAVCGCLGESAAGLSLLLEKQRGVTARLRRRLLRAHFEPRPQLETGSRLAALGASAMIDTSDGLLRDLGHICRESGVGADIELDRVPVSRDLVRFAEQRGRDPLDFALDGGEDYRLLFCLPPAKWARLERVRLPSGERPVVIGRIAERGGIRLFHRGRPARRRIGGFEHFGKRSRG